ncbi:MAG: M48 family metalloprotease [Simkaniaceae bacterium]|nr:M48 family metalloprotease [Simkaniaceae bacterium]
MSKFVADRFFGHFTKAYRCVCGEEDPPAESFPSDRVTEPRGDGPYLLESMKAGKQGLLHRAGVRKDIAVVQCRCSDVGCAVGINALRWGDAVIYLDGDICRTDRECAGFFLNHEIKHILSNDIVTLGIVAGMNDLARPTISAVGCFKAMRAFSRRGVAGIVAPLLGVVVARLVSDRIVGALSRWREAKADDFAIAHATDEELKGGWRCFTAYRRMRTDESRILWGLFAENLSRPFGLWREWIMVSSSVGWYLCNPGHPSDKSRLHKIEKALVVRGIAVDEMAEEQRVERLRIRVAEQMASHFLHLFSKSYPPVVYRAYGSMVASGSTDTSERPGVPRGS